MTYDEVHAAASRLTFDPNLGGEIVNLVIRAIIDERIACAKIAETVEGDFQRDTATRTENMVRKGIADAIRNRSSL